MSDVGIDPGHFRQYVVKPALTGINLWSQSAENLLVGTALAESRLKWLHQVGGGPAMGVFQMEPRTHKDLWTNWLRYRRGYLKYMQEHTRSLYDLHSRLDLLHADLAYAALCCRLQYRRFREVLPDHHDVAGLAQYWKTHWNTHEGDGKVETFVDLYEEHGAES